MSILIAGYSCSIYEQTVYMYFREPNLLLQCSLYTSSCRYNSSTMQTLILKPKFYWMYKVYIITALRKETKQFNWSARLILNKQNKLNILIGRYTETAMYLPNPGSCRLSLVQIHPQISTWNQWLAKSSFKSQVHRIMMIDSESQISTDNLWYQFTVNCGRNC